MPRRQGSPALSRRVGARVRSLREDAGITQETLAWECDLAKGYLSQVEAGKRLPSLAVVFAIARRLRVEAADIVGFDLGRPRLRMMDEARRGERGTGTIREPSARVGNPVDPNLKYDDGAEPVDAMKRLCGRRIAAERARHGWTQAALAAALDVSVQYVQRVEGGKQNMTLATLVRIAGALGVEVVTLVSQP